MSPSLTTPTLAPTLAPTLTLLSHHLHTSSTPLLSQGMLSASPEYALKDANRGKGVGSDVASSSSSSSSGAAAAAAAAAAAGTVPELYVSNEHPRRRLVFRSAVRLLASRSNAGAETVANILRAGVANQIDVTTDVDKLPKRTRRPSLAFGVGLIDEVIEFGSDVLGIGTSTNRANANANANANASASANADANAADGQQGGSSSSSPGSASAAASAAAAADAAAADATHFLLYLNAETFEGAAGKALADELRRARRVGMPIVMLHENDPTRGGCEFGRFFQTTPDDLIASGLCHCNGQSGRLAGATAGHHRKPHQGRPVKPWGCPHTPATSHPLPHPSPSTRMGKETRPPWPHRAAVGIQPKAAHVDVSRVALTTPHHRYHEIAAAWYPGAYRPTSIALVALRLGATPQRQFCNVRRRHAFTTAATAAAAEAIAVAASRPRRLSAVSASARDLLLAQQQPTAVPGASRLPAVQSTLPLQRRLPSRKKLSVAQPMPRMPSEQGLLATVAAAKMLRGSGDADEHSQHSQHGQHGQHGHLCHHFEPSLSLSLSTKRESSMVRASATSSCGSGGSGSGGGLGVQGEGKSAEEEEEAARMARRRATLQARRRSLQAADSTKSLFGHKEGPGREVSEHRKTQLDKKSQAPTEQKARARAQTQPHAHGEAQGEGQPAAASSLPAALAALATLSSVAEGPDTSRHESEHDGAPGASTSASSGAGPSSSASDAAAAAAAIPQNGPPSTLPAAAAGTPPTLHAGVERSRARGKAKASVHV